MHSVIAVLSKPLQTFYDICDDKVVEVNRKRSRHVWSWPSWTCQCHDRTQAPKAEELAKGAIDLCLSYQTERG